MRESIAIRRELVTAQPTAHEPHLARALTNLALWQERAERPGQAVESAHEGLGLMLRAFEGHPEAHRDDLEHCFDTYQRAVEAAEGEPDGKLVARAVLMLAQVG